MATATASSSLRKDALVVCDAQPDVLGSVTPPSRQAALVYWMNVCLELARQRQWTICYTGIRFAPGYEGVSPQHKLFGGLARLHKASLLF